jgi:hypothetical protein
MNRSRKLIAAACVGWKSTSMPPPSTPRRQEPVRRRAGRRTAQVGDPGRARADGKGPGLQPGHRAPADAHDPQRSIRPGSGPGRRRRAYVEYFPAFIKRGIDRRAARPKLAKFDLAKLSKALVADRDLQFGYIGLQTLYDRYFLHIQRHPHRNAAGVLHARRDGPVAARSEPRRARDRVLQPAVELRLHELDADPVQLGHAALAAVVVLSDHRLGRPGRHLRSDQGQRAAGQVRRRPGQRLDAGAFAGRPHQGHQRQIAGRGAVPESGQRHRRGGQPGRQAQGRGLRVPGNLAHGHRGIPRPAQEHRRRPPPHARHEHRELDSRPVHEARDGKR